MTVNIYGLVNPLSKKIFYVGATNNKLKSRLSGHIVAAKNYDRDGGHCKKRMEFILKLLNKGVKPKIILLKAVGIDEAGFYERHYYNVLRSLGCNLLQASYRFDYQKKMKAWDKIMNDRDKYWYKEGRKSYFS
jgi:hypothetical protein